MTRAAAEPRPGGGGDTPGRYWLLWFARAGAASYVSHLDTVRALQRTFARAGVALALSKGFRPRARLSLPLPLPVGAAGLDELAVAEVADGAPPPARALGALRAAAPPGLTPQRLQMSATRPHPRPVEARYAAEIRGDPDALMAAATWFAAQEGVTVERVTPKGRRMLDLTKYVGDLVAQPVPGGARVTFVVRHRRDGAARPQEVIDLLAGRAGCAPVAHHLTRLRVSYEGLPRDAWSGGEE